MSFLHVRRSRWYAWGNYTTAAEEESAELENGDGGRGRQGCASWGHGEQEGGRRAGEDRDRDEMR